MTKLGFSFFVCVLCYSIFCNGCMFAFVVLGLVFFVVSQERLGRTSAK